MKKLFSYLIILNFLALSFLTSSFSYAFIDDIIGTTVGTAGNITKSTIEGATDITKATISTPERIVKRGEKTDKNKTENESKKEKIKEQVEECQTYECKKNVETTEIEKTKKN